MIMQQVYLHVLFALIFAAILYPFIGNYSIVVFLSGFVIDIDHYLYYIIKKNDLNFMNGYLYHVPGSKVHESHHDSLHIFHTWEMWLLFLILAFIIHEVFLFILVGFIFHMLFDWGYLLFNKDALGERAWALIGWISRN